MPNYSALFFWSFSLLYTLYDLFYRPVLLVSWNYLNVIFKDTSGEKFKEAGNFLEKSLGKEGAYNTTKHHQQGRWRKGITLLAYFYGYAIGYSFFRKSQIWG
jgi:hypothetical protein